MKSRICPNCGHKMVYEDETEDGKVIKEPYYWCYFCQSGRAEEGKEMLYKQVWSKLKKFEEKQMRKIDKFEEKQMRKIDDKTEEVRVLIKATKEGRLIDFARLSPDEYNKTMKNLCRKTSRAEEAENGS